MTNVRLSAARVLLALEHGQTTLAAELEAAREGIEDRRDRALLVELATGAIRWRSELDALIGTAARRHAAGIEPPALAVLRLGTYQIRHLERVPHHAVVNESVGVVRKLGAPRAAGFVNAVLRALIRRGPALALPPRPGPGAPLERQLSYLATSLSHPPWLVRRWIDRYGFDDTERWCRFNNTSPEMTVRPLGARTAGALRDLLRSDGIDPAPAPFVEDAIRLAPGSLGRISPAVRDALSVQDEGSQIVARFAQARPGERVLDVCASPGGKTLVLATDLAIGDGGGASLVAGDRRLKRVRLLAERCRRAGLAIPLVALDALGPLPFGPAFDCVLLDVPCSGLGVLRRDPDLKWSRREQDLPRLAADQVRMLRSAAELVRPGGRLVYATCSSEPDENTGPVDAFLSQDPRFTLHAADPSKGIPAALLDAQGRLVTLPFRHELDAFFAAILVRRPAT